MSHSLNTVTETTEFLTNQVWITDHQTILQKIMAVILQLQKTPRDRLSAKIKRHHSE